MFEKITLKNYRSHKKTTIKFYPITLFIGNNNSGKSNFLRGLQHFSNLIAHSYPRGDFKHKLTSEDFYPHRYYLAKPKEPITFQCVWKDDAYTIKYKLELSDKDRMYNIKCREEIELKSNIKGSKSNTIKTDWENEISLIAKLPSYENLCEAERETFVKFFYSLSTIQSYHFQSSYLKNGKIEKEIHQYGNADLYPIYLGYEGDNFQNILLLAKRGMVEENNEEPFNLFTVRLRRFDNTFHNIRYDNIRNEILWGFDLGEPQGKITEFTTDSLSDGFIKAAAISLLSSLRSSTKLILLEEIENGINPANIEKIIYWLGNMSALGTQIILTSHSPSVLREFSDYLNQVYTFHLHRKGHRSEVVNLNKVLIEFIKMGALDGEIEKRGNLKIVKIERYRLTQLWYSGTIG